MSNKHKELNEHYKKISKDLDLAIEKFMDSEKAKIRESILIPFCKKWNVGYDYGMGSCTFVMPNGKHIGDHDIWPEPEYYDENPEKKHGADWTQERIDAFKQMFLFLYTDCYGRAIGWDMDNIPVGGL